LRARGGLVPASAQDEVDRQFVGVEAVAQLRKRLGQELQFVEQLAKTDLCSAPGEFEDVR